jgi:hypothetical protein
VPFYNIIKSLPEPNFKDDDEDFDYSSDRSKQKDKEFDPFEYPSETDSDEWLKSSPPSLKYGSGTVAT